MKDNTILPIILIIALSIGIALFAYFLLIHFTVDNSFYPMDLARTKNLLNFYEHPSDGDIFILGSSLVREGVDANVVEDILKKRQINHSVYNLAMNADTPLDRVCEVDNIISSRPKMIVIGISYVGLGNISIYNKDRVSLCFQRNQINKEMQFLFTDDEIKFVSQSPFEGFFDQRKYLFNSIIPPIPVQSSEANIRKNLYLTNFKDPWFNIGNTTETKKNEARRSVLRNRTNLDLLSEDLNSQKQAFQYTITKFQKNNIRVIVINMPLDPNYSSIINESSRHILSNFLNSTGVLWYNYEREYPPDYFFDNMHMNVAGRTDFSPKVATIIADNLIQGA